MRSEQLTHLKISGRSGTSPLHLAFDSFLLDAEARRLTERTLQYYKQQLEPFLGNLKDHTVYAPEGITAHHIRSYMVQLQRRGLSDASVHAAARAIRAFCNFMVREELLEKSPMRKVQMPRMEKPIKPAFKTADVKALLSACETKRDTAIILALLDSGCRASEFVGLNIGDVDMKTGSVRVRHGKGRKHRVVFLGAKARKALLKYMMGRSDMLPDRPLWHSFTTGERLTDWGLRIMLRRVGDNAQVENCSPHTFRRSFALWSLRSGMNIYALQQIMGHSDLTILRQYLALVEEDLQDAHRRYGAVDNIL